MDDVSRCAGAYRGTALTRRPFLLLATVSRSRRCAALRADGRGASAKHAVNPSMGARSAHPCASRFCAGPTPIRFKHCPRLLLPPGSREKKDQIQIQIQIQSQKPKPQFLALPLLLPLLPPWGLMRPRPQETVMGGRGPQPGPLAPWARGMPRAGWAGRPTPVLPCAQESAHEQGAIEPPWMGSRRVLAEAPCLPSTTTTRRQTPQPRALLGFTRFPKKIALISSRSVPCQYLRCAGSSANSTTLPCPCADTSNHALPATRVRLRSDR